MEDRPRNLKAMLSEAKDTSELMVDLGYAALFFADERMADEVSELEELLTELVHEMREVCVLAGRSKRDAEQMSSVLHVVSAIERMGNAAVDVSRIVTHRLGIPPALVADLAAAEEVSHRVRVRADSALANRTLEDVELPMETGMRVVAIRRGREWLFDPDGDEQRCSPDDVLILRGQREGIAEVRELAGAPEWRPAAVEEDPAITDLDRAVDVLVDMKNVSEAAVGLAYCALLLKDQGLAAQVTQLEDRLDEMREQLELWVLRAGGRDRRPVRPARASAPRRRVRGGRRRRPAARLARRRRRGDAPGPRGRARRDRRRGRAVSDRAGQCARRRRDRRARKSATTPASTCSRSGAAAATSTARAASRSRPATRCSRAARGTAAPRSPSSAASGSSKTTTPARSSSSPPNRTSAPRLGARDRERQEYAGEADERGAGVAERGF